MLRLLVFLVVVALTVPCCGQDDFFGPLPQKPLPQKSSSTQQVIDGNQPNAGVFDGTRLAEILNSLQQARNERKEIQEAVTELQQQYGGLLDTLAELRENLRQQREENKALREALETWRLEGHSLREALVTWRREHDGIIKNLGDFLKEGREERAAARGEWLENLRKMREERREDLAAWFTKISETQGPIRQALKLLTGLVWSLIVFIGVVAVVSIVFKFFVK